MGDDNIVIFGLTAEEVAKARKAAYNAARHIEASPHFEAGAGIDLVTGIFSPDEPNRYRGLIGGPLRP